MDIPSFKGYDYYQPYIDAVNVATEETIEKAIEDVSVIAEWNMEEYNGIENKASLFKIFKRDAHEYAEISEIKTDFDIACRIQKLNESNSGLDTIYSEMDEIFGFSKALPSGKNGTVIEDMSENIRNKVFEECAGKDFNSREDLAKELVVSALVVSIKNAEHYGDIKNVIESYNNAGIINVNTKSDKSVSVYKKMMGNGYSDTKGVENGYNAILKGLEKTNGGSSSGGGGGGSGKSYTRPMPTVTTEPSAPEQSNETNDQTKTEDKPNTPKMVFSDMEDAKWALPSVEIMYERGVINGIGDGLFAPHNFVTRAEFAKMAVLLAGYSDNGEVINFSDVANDEWYSNSVKIACQNGIFVGNENGTFGVTDHITREQIALVVYRMISDKIEDTENTTAVFSDDGEIDDVFKSAVYKLNSLKIVNGRGDGLFCPNENVTRVEAAVLLANISKYF